MDQLVKVAGKNRDDLVDRVLKADSIELNTDNFAKLLKELSEDPYIYLGSNNLPHRMIQNRE